jgi:antitoxin VapB
MSLNIKNERVHALVRQAADRTGRSQTSVVEEALREYLDRLEQEHSRVEKDRRVDEILADMHARLAAIPGGLDLSTDYLYDENGLPA